MSSILDMFNIEDTENSDLSEDIAIIGMAGKLPLADSLDEYWANILSHRDCVRNFPSSRECLVGQYAKKSGKKDIAYKESAYLDRIDLFDYEFFHISPREAKLIDPKQRMLLETAWNTIEDAGYAPDSLKGERVGVYIGYRADEMFDYRSYLYAIQPDSLATATAGNLVSILASRISYALDFCGPSMVIDTACSSSSVAIHAACKAILCGECTQAIVGSAAFNIFPIKMDYKLGIESTTSRCMTFDEEANGAGSGEGVIVIMLKSLAEAKRDKDHIYAVIKSSFINQDGKSIGITAPRPDAQADVIINAWQNGEINPETISYIEAHGTGTQLGDPIEIQGITQAFSKYTNKKQFCGIGSVKTMIGHLDNLAGLAGVIKMIYAMQNRIMPASMNFIRPNSKIEFEDCPVYVNDQNQDWESFSSPLRCGINSFGMSGTNSHIVLEEYRESYLKEKDESDCVFVLSAKNEQSLKDLVKEYIPFLKKNVYNSIQDICYTCSMGRSHFQYRLAILVQNVNDLITKLEKIEKDGWKGNKEDDIYYGCADGDYITKENVNYKDEKQICAEYVNGNTGILEHSYHKNQYHRVRLPGYQFQKLSCWITPNDNWGEEKNRSLSVKVNSPVFHGSMIRLMDQIVFLDTITRDKYWTIRDHRVEDENVMVGTVYAEIVAECVHSLGVTENFSLRNLMLLTPLKLKADEERMLHVSFKEKEFGYSVHVASSDGGDAVVMHGKCSVDVNIKKENLSCDFEMVKENARKIFNYRENKRIETNSTFAFGERWNNITDIWKGEGYILKRCELPKKYKGEASYYMLHPALMDMAINNVVNIELTDQTVKSQLYLPLSYLSICFYKALPPVIYSYVKINPLNSDSIMSFDINLMNESGEILVKIEDYVIGKVTKENKIQSDYLSNYFYKPEWKITNWIKSETIRNEKILIFRNQNNEDYELEALSDENQIIQVYEGKEYKKIHDNLFEVSSNWEDYFELSKKIGSVDRVIHMFSLKAEENTKSIDEMHTNLEYGVYSLIGLLKAVIGSQNEKLILSIITRNGFAIEASDSKIIPENAALASLPQVISAEYPQIQVNCVDTNEQVTVEHLISEISAQKEPVVALRKEARYVLTIEKTTDIKVENLNTAWKKDGIYVITGGTGEIGIRIVEYLVEQNCSVIVLIGRRRLPDVSIWNTLSENDVDPDTYATISKLNSIINSDTHIYYFTDDLSDTVRLNTLFENIRRKIGGIRGIFHCAGVAGSSYIIRKSESDLKKVFLPKVDGTWNLIHAKLEDELDFMVLFSSTVALAGGAGQSDYGYANAYMDALAEASRLRNGNVISINWTAWNDIGMALRSRKVLDGIQYSISSAEAMDVLSIALNAGQNRLIIGRVNYEFNSEKVNNSIKKIKTDSYDQIEYEITHIWKQVLEYDTIGIHDDFFSIGGDSILLSQVHEKINEIYFEVVTVANLFTYTTIYKLSMFLFEQFNIGDVSAKESKKETIESNEDVFLFDLLDKFEKGDIDIDKAFESLEDSKE